MKKCISELKPGDSFKREHDNAIFTLISVGTYVIRLRGYEHIGDPQYVAIDDKYELYTWTGSGDFEVEALPHRDTTAIVKAAIAFAEQDEAYLNNADGSYAERNRLIVNLLTAVQRLKKGYYDGSEC